MSSDRRSCAVVVAATLVGCTPAAPHYGYQYQLARQFSGGEEPESASAEARQLLATARTVAFYPPDICLNSEAGQGPSPNQRMVRASCGVLLSTLERAAERAGYEVLSWQNLRGNKRPIDFAREANVDVLFEINEFDLGQLDDSTVQRTMTFFERSPAGAEQPLQVTGRVAERCRAYAAGHDAAQAAAVTGTVDIKTVSVVDGRSRWRYRKTAAQALVHSYPQVTFRATATPPWASPVLGGLGVVGITLGTVLWLTAETSTNDPAAGTKKLDFGPYPAYSAIGGVVAIAGAVAVSLIFKGDVAPPEAVMCLHAEAPPPVATTTTISAAPLASAVTFSDTTHADPLVRERERIRDAMIADFIAQLAETHRNAPPPAPTPAPAPATPASAAPAPAPAAHAPAAP